MKGTLENLEYGTIDQNKQILKVLELKDLRELYLYALDSCFNKKGKMIYFYPRAIDLLYKEIDYREALMKSEQTQ